MDRNKKARRFLLIGAIIGGLLSLTVSILLDTLYADTFQGTWRDAIAKDLKTIFSVQVTPNSFIVYILFAVVLSILSAFGALLGFIFSFFLYKFFSFLNEK